MLIEKDLVTIMDLFEKLLPLMLLIVGLLVFSNVLLVKLYYDLMTYIKGWIEKKRD